MNPRDIIAQAAQCSLVQADRVLAALVGEGYRIVKQEQIGWTEHGHDVWQGEGMPGERRVWVDSEEPG